MSGISSRLHPTWKKTQSNQSITWFTCLFALHPSAGVRSAVYRWCQHAVSTGSRHRAVLQLQGLNCWLGLNHNRMSVHCIDSDSGLVFCVLGLLPFFFCLFSPSVEAPVPFIVPSLTYWVYLQVVTLMVTSVPFITRCVRRAGEFWSAKAFWWHFRALWGTNVVQNPFGFSIVCICKYENINLV